ncbi:MAG: hypothetical protein C4526_04395 [Nitrospiraceae bacterium]|nr:MAG: hypothetical protein C4526_04395 [Nitrospiraceae bacterium]
MNRNGLLFKFLYLTVFAVAMAFSEASVVVYLRAIFRPEGFQFPMQAMTDFKITVEVFREAATIFMLLSVAFLAGKGRWERSAYFMFSFSVWDIFYYVWLKVLLDWPASIFDWDILFLIPHPWIAPVIAPVSVSILMMTSGVLIAWLLHKGYGFKPEFLSYIFAASGTALLLYSFMHDTGAALRRQMPEPYRYELLIAGDALLVAAFLAPYLKIVRQKG